LRVVRSVVSILNPRRKINLNTFLVLAIIIRKNWNTAAFEMELPTKKNVSSYSRFSSQKVTIMNDRNHYRKGS